MALRAPLPSDEELARIYDATYYDSWGADAAYWELKRALFRAVLAAAGTLPAAGEALDVGCATGACLATMAELGLRPVGVDVNPFAVEAARAKVPTAEVHLGRLEGLDLGTRRFAVAVLSDVIEHVRDPWDFMARLRELMRPGGAVLILTPNIRSLSARLLRGRWPHYKAEHLHLFSPRSLAELLSATGYRLTRLRPFPKPLSLGYAMQQFAAYPLPLATPLTAALGRILPKAWLARTLPLPIGEVLAVARV